MGQVGLRVAKTRAMIGRLGFPWRAAAVPGGVAPAPPSHRLGADYDTDWARRMTGRGEFVAWHRTPAGALWSTSVFDLESSDDAAQVHHGL